MCSLVLTWFHYQLLRSRLFQCALFISNFMLCLLSFDLVLVQVFKCLVGQGNLRISKNNDSLPPFSPKFFRGCWSHIINSHCFNNILRKLSPYCLTLASRFVLNHYPFASQSYGLWRQLWSSISTTFIDSLWPLISFNSNMHSSFGVISCPSIT